MTLAAVNAADADALLAAFKAKRVAHYQAIAASDPTKRTISEGMDRAGGEVMPVPPSLAPAIPASAHLDW